MPGRASRGDGIAVDVDEQDITIEGEDRCGRSVEASVPTAVVLALLERVGLLPEPDPTEDLRALLRRAADALREARGYAADVSDYVGAGRFDGLAFDIDLALGDRPESARTDSRPGLGDEP